MKQRAKKSGFTLIELLVTLGIFLVMTSVVLARYRSFSINADFANTVENIILSVREAQVYGSGSKTAGATACGGSAFNCAYGVRFTDGGTSYIVFVDQDENNAYTNSLELIKTIDLPLGTTLSLSPNTVVDVVFKRPFPDAIINGTSNTSASIRVSNSTKSQIISITSAGQISVQ